MKLEMRRALAREPFAEKIRKVEALLQLSAELRTQRTSNRRKSSEKPGDVHPDPRIVFAIRHKCVLGFIYNGKSRIVEPQTYGLSTTGRELLRAYERTTGQTAKRSGMAKLFDVKKISGLRETGQTFQEALPAHNPDDSAMVETFATLPAPKN